MASIQRRPDGRWRARYRDDAGTEHARHFDRKIDARRWLDTITTAVVSGTYCDPKAGRVTVAAYAAQWLQVQPIRATSRRSWTSYLTHHVLPALGDRPMSSVTRSQVLAVRRDAEQKLSPNTVRGIMALTASVFAAAVEDGLIAKSPCRGTVPVRPRRPKVEPLTVDQVNALVDAAPERYRAMVVLGAGCGLRVGEVLGLKAGRVRFLARELDVHEQLVLLPGRPPYLGPPKTRGSYRTVPLPEVVAEALAEHLRTFPAGLDDLVFRSRTGGPVWPNTFNGSVWRPLTRRAGLPGVRFHDLRHFTASALIRYGESVKTVAAVLGHSDETETLRTYSHLWPDASDRTMAAVDGLFRSSGADSVRTDAAAYPP